MIGLGCADDGRGRPDAGGTRPDAERPSLDATAERSVRDAADGASIPSADGGRRDCLPACIADLRRSCRRPVTGTCQRESQGDKLLFCYSNGVREIYEPGTDATDFVTTVTYADGRTPCYVVESRGPEMILVYKTAGGAEVARSIGTPTGDRMITCGGQSHIVRADELASEACRDLNGAACTFGACPR